MDIQAKRPTDLNCPPRIQWLADFVTPTLPVNNDLKTPNIIDMLDNWFAVLEAPVKIEPPTPHDITSPNALYLDEFLMDFEELSGNQNKPQEDQIPETTSNQFHQDAAEGNEDLPTSFSTNSPDRIQEESYYQHWTMEVLTITQCTFTVSKLAS